MPRTVRTWAIDQEEEDRMNDDHAPLWRQMIALSCPAQGDECVLDFGCNQGGFLEMLYRQRRYEKAVGVDIAADSLTVARKRLANLPVTLGDPAILSDMKDIFDRAYSHEVLYLLPDLNAHAATIKNVLKPGGAYYAAIGCHTDQPLWPQWKPLIESYSSVPVMSYSLDDYANAFADAGLDVALQPYRLTGFLPHRKGSAYFPKATDTIRYYTQDKVLFRFEKQR